MHQLRTEATGLSRLDPIETKGTADPLEGRPEYRFQRDVIESWLKRSNLVDVDTQSPLAANA